ncbi:hypothetical protein CVT24_008340 [Panaeolus cyanescens]|uniref:t-SNARE coiled-coil homology domain-containing protein n=1 Tax=Panaeolus cyanescens TaxID=181874 RepID=A0A409VCB1_9AGAR|nr:hypothetical protein CVT24_008340 [Panaeolus cyanescens]
MASKHTLLSLSETEVADVLQHIDEYEQANYRLELEVEAHMRTIRQLRHKKEQNDLVIRRYKGMIGLATRLPPEIMAYIFEMCVADGWTRTPLVVSHVCSAWRKAALTPSVWSHVYVNIDLSREPYDRAQLWLERSQQMSLDVTIEVVNESIWMRNVIDLLASHAHRWRSLTIRSFYLISANDILGDIGPKAMEHLSQVNISVSEEFSNAQGLNPEESQILNLPITFANAPNLKTLLLKRNILPTADLIPSSVQALTLQLTSVGVTSQQSIGAILQLLEGLPQLVQLTIEVPVSQTQIFTLDVVTPQLVDLPDVQALTIAGSNDIFSLLGHIRTPSLQHLHLRSYLEEVQPDQNAAYIRQFLANSAAPITVLEIRDMTLSPESYNSLFQHLKSLKELHLHDSDIIDSALNQLHGEDAFCPNLDTMDFRWCGRLTGRGLVDLVKGRTSAGSHIKSVTVLNCAHVKEEDILELASMTTCRLRHFGSTDICGRAELVASKVNPLTRLLPARLRQDESTLSSDVLAAHHAGITWYLSRRLTEASQTQKELQEERIKRQLERTRSLGSNAAQEAMSMSTRQAPVQSQSNSQRGPGSWFESTIAATIGVTSSYGTPRKSYTPIPQELSEDEDDDFELTASQIMQFETENAHILKSVQDTLESVQQAESRLTDISALQMELVTHLTRQTELTDQLYEDALATTSTVEKGNEQLKEAKRRAKDGRLFVLVFLIGASFSLLFLHYY